MFVKLAILLTRNLPNSLLQPLMKILGRFYDKHKSEMMFQKMWVKKFKANKHLAKEYWEKYRYLSEILTITKIKKSTKVLDVGCGISSVLHFVPGKKYGIDPLADEYKKIYRYPKDMTIVSGSGEEIPFKKNEFGVVFCTNVLDHTENPTKVVSEISRVLRSKGYFVLTVELFDTPTKRDLAHPHGMTQKMVDSLLKKNYTKVFAKKSPWIGLYNYVVGKRKERNKEYISIWKKKI